MSTMPLRSAPTTSMNHLTSFSVRGLCHVETVGCAAISWRPAGVSRLMGSADMQRTTALPDAGMVR
jgi:hypothetical protein